VYILPTFRHKQAQTRTQGPDGSAFNLAGGLSRYNLVKDRSVLFYLGARIHFNAAKDQPRAHNIVSRFRFAADGFSSHRGKLFLEHFPSAPNCALTASLALWLAITGANMWIGGVSIVGYSVAEELPILVLPFAVPTAAVLLRWRFF
jgi:hypothetical protein